MSSHSTTTSDLTRPALGARWRLKLLQLHTLTRCDRLLRRINNLNHADIDIDGGHALDRLILPDSAGHERHRLGLLLRPGREIQSARLGPDLLQSYRLLLHIDAAVEPINLQVLIAARQVPTGFEDADA